MNKEEYEFWLADRIAKIQAINAQYDLEHNAYISFSGGKDSTVLHYLIDLALPNNKIPRVYINTGVEYLDIVKFVKELATTDDRIVIYNSGVNLKKMWQEYGYPFKSKEHSQKVNDYKQGSRSASTLKYKAGGSFQCPSILQYQYKDDFNLKISNKCCFKLKKEPVAKWQKENNKTIALTGMLKEEGGQRNNLRCIVTDKDGNVKKFHPLAVVSKDWEEMFIEQNNVKLCRLYYPPFNFKRTGCRGCPYALKLQDQLDALAIHLPKEAKLCEALFEPVYKEYRRLGYRLRKDGVYKQTTIDEFLHD